LGQFILAQYTGTSPPPTSVHLIVCACVCACAGHASSSLTPCVVCVVSCDGCR
jgi:hypothetical protein